MTTKINFSAGPATLPVWVKNTIQKGLFDFENTGFSVLEIGHRTPPIEALFKDTEKKVRDLLDIDSRYAVLFVPGGARSVFSALPLNFADKNLTADYLITGVWSEMAAIEAQKYVTLKRSLDITNPPKDAEENVAYVHYCDNETIEGVSYPYPPQTNEKLICDMTSSLFTKKIQIEDYACVYAACQKNLGVAGVTLVIVRKDMLGHAHPKTPSMLNYDLHYQSNSMFNTPPVFAVYVLNAMLTWMQQEGGVAAMQHKIQSCAQAIYEVIDTSFIYKTVVPKEFRSATNVTFTLDNTPDFLEKAQQAGFYYLKGHKRVGGIRASFYTGQLSDAGMQLASFMRQYAHSTF